MSRVTQTATVVAGESVTVDFSLVAAPTFSVSGTVTDAMTGEPIAGATVSLGAPIPDIATGEDGTYAFAEVPTGEYTLTVDAGGCAEPYSADVVVDGDETFDVELEPIYDDFGYYCTVGSGDYLQGTELLDVSGDDASATVDLPFAFSLYGESYDEVNVATNGYVNFLAANAAYANVAIPSSAVPNAALYPFWDDLEVDDEAGIYTGETEVDGESAFVVEYRNVAPLSGEQRLNFSVTVTESGLIVFGYGDLTGDARAEGNSATVGIENSAGSIAYQYSFNEAVLEPGLSITYALPPHGFVMGTVTDYNDGLPIEGATITATPADGGDPHVVTTDENGYYEALLFFGSYTVTISDDGYVSKSKDIVINVDGETNTFNAKLKTGIANVEPSSYSWVLAEGETRSADLTISNTGSAPLDFTIGELPRNVNLTPQAPALSANALTDGVVPSGRPRWPTPRHRSPRSRRRPRTRTPTRPRPKACTPQPRSRHASRPGSRPTRRVTSWSRGRPGYRVSVGASGTPATSGSPMRRP